MEEKETIKVFVYGTLLTGFGNWEWSLKPQEGFPDSISGFEMFTLGGYPGILPVENEDTTSVVKGEIFEVDKDLLIRLDRLEGYKEGRSYNHYIRERIVTDSGIEAFTYVYGNERIRTTQKKIESGSWKEYTGV